MRHATAVRPLLATPFATSLVPLTVRLIPVITQIGRLLVRFRRADLTPQACHQFETQLHEQLREVGRIIVEWISLTLAFSAFRLCIPRARRRCRGYAANYHDISFRSDDGRRSGNRSSVASAAQTAESSSTTPTHADATPTSPGARAGSGRRTATDTARSSDGPPRCSCDGTPGEYN